MEIFEEFLSHISNPENKARTEEILAWILKTYPNLAPRIAWNQPMFTDHGTFIIGFSIAKHHLAVAPERVAIQHFAEDVKKVGYDSSSELIRFPWNKPVDFDLLGKLIEYNIADKADCTTFWRK